MTNPDLAALFSPIALARQTLSNRIVMSAMTRGRTPGGSPNALNAKYYGDRAGAGLIIAESTAISPYAVGFPNSPNIFSEEDVIGWKGVTDAVHAGGGRICLQLWHCGRNAHPSILPDNRQPIGPSATPPPRSMRLVDERLTPVTPRALEVEEMPELIEEYRHAARSAMAAGFDAVEVHAGNGYLMDQFLRDCSNQRTDQYGGSPENRRRLLLEVVEAVAAIWGEDRVGVRISPTNKSGWMMEDSDPQGLFNCVVEGLDEIGIGFLDVVHGETTDQPEVPFDYSALRARFSGVYIANNGFSAASANDAIAQGRTDLVAFGRPFIANPDLADRFRIGAPLNALDVEALHLQGERGYTDYPVMEDAALASNG